MWNEHLRRHVAAVPKGFLKYHILELLSRKPMSGVEIMNEIEKITNGAWRPLPGSVYPILQYLKENGYTKEVRTGRKDVKKYALTGRGKALLKKIRELRMRMAAVGAVSPPLLGLLCLGLPPEKAGEAAKSVRKIAQGIVKASSGERSEEKMERILKVLKKAADEIDRIAGGREVGGGNKG